VIEQPGPRTPDLRLSLRPPGWQPDKVHFFHRGRLYSREFLDGQIMAGEPINDDLISRVLTLTAARALTSCQDADRLQQPVDVQALRSRQ
jgi:hypothetical protein